MLDMEVLLQAGGDSRDDEGPDPYVDPPNDPNIVAMLAEALHSVIISKDDYDLKPCDEEASVLLADTEDPTNWTQAMRGENRDHWVAALKREQKSILDMGTFAPPCGEYNSRPISSKYHLKTKIGSDGQLVYKVRLVVRGFEERPGIDEQTYAPVSKLTSLRMMVALAASRGWHLHHMDVVAAFLNPDIDETIFIRLPPSKDSEDEWELPWLDRTSRTVMLRKALYGLRRSPRLWWIHIHEFLLSLGFEQSAHESNLYTKPNVAILLYVDDLLIAFNPECSYAMLEVKDSLLNKYQMKDMGEARRFVGIEITRTYDDQGLLSTMILSQNAYVSEVIKRFGLGNDSGHDVVRDPKYGYGMQRIKNRTGTYHTPMDLKIDIDNGAVDDQPMQDVRLYQSIIGSIMYAALGTRPDVAFAVTALAKFSAAPLQMHHTAAIRLLRYLRTTSNLGLHYHGFSSETRPDADPDLEIAEADSSTPRLQGWTDSDWAGDTNERRSVGGFTFAYSNGRLTGAPICWQSKRQTVVALSTLEAEFIAASNATREAKWLRLLEADMLSITERNEDTREATPPPMVLWADNQGALKLIETGIVQAKSKHIDVKHRHSHDEQQKGTVSFQYVPSAANIADVMTKPFARPRHEELAKMLNLFPC